MTMSNILYKLIHERAASNWSEPVTRENYGRWARHWLNCTLALAENFDADGLPDTAAAFRKIHAEQSKLNGFQGE